jgi:hypothetical protein
MIVTLGGRRPTCLPPYAKASGGKPSRSSKSVGWVIQKYHVNQCVSLIATLAALIRNDNEKYLYAKNSHHEDSQSRKGVGDVVIQKCHI